jgi:hypothetical protein
VQTFLGASANEAWPSFSPDGRWVAAGSDESGPYEIHVRSFPDPVVKLQVSVGGAAGPLWSADGSRLYYVTGNAIMAARLAPGPLPRVLSRDTAFAPVRSGAARFGQANFDVTRDGSRIVIPIDQSEGYKLVVVPNWITEFRERMAASRAR